MLDMVSAELWARHIETSVVVQASDRDKKKRHSGASESAAASMIAKVMGKGPASAKAADTGPASAKAADTDGAGRARNGSPNLLQLSEMKFAFGLLTVCRWQQRFARNVEK